MSTSGRASTRSPSIRGNYTPEASRRPFSPGWPAGGGVWILSEDGEIAGKKHAGMLFNAYTMDERCNIIEQLGGTFYANPKDCPDLDLPA